MREPMVVSQPAEVNYGSVDGSAVYQVLKQLGNGDLVKVDSLDNLEDALKLVRGLNALWPGIYAVWGWHGK
jgi:hypothetical protein